MKTGGIRSMRIEPGQGGFTSQIHRSSPKGEYVEPELPTIHPSVGHLQAHIGKVFGKKGAKPQAASSPSPTHAAIAGQMSKY